MNSKRIVFENPSPAKRGRNGGAVQAFITRLSETKDQWAVFSREVKHVAYYYSLASQRNDLDVAVRANTDGKTYTVYMMALGTEAMKEKVAKKTQRELAKKLTAKKIAIKKSKTKV